MFSNRLLLLRILLLTAFLVFAGRLVVLQLWQGAEMRQLSENNRLRWVRSIPARGRILDRKGRPLATSVPALTVWLIPSEVPRKSWPELGQQLVSLGIYPDLITAQSSLEEFEDFPSFLPVSLDSGLSIKDPRISRIEENLPFLPGIYLKIEPIRYYPEGALASHAIGFLSKYDEEAIKKQYDEGYVRGAPISDKAQKVIDEYRASGYRVGDLLGKTGVEDAFENMLRGKEGGEQVEVDAFGRKVRTLETTNPQPGTDISLTIDLDIQRAAEKAMVGHSGAVVALNPNNGDILALVSSPSFDLNKRGGNRNEFNRALRGVYPPGSVFKIVTAAAGLENGKIHSGTYFHCDGRYNGIACWKHDGHGTLALSGALANSCNVYFMKTAEKVGAQPLADMARRFGLEEKIYIDSVLTGNSGFVPDPAWARKDNRPWVLGDTLQMGMGQSALTLTPMQAARIAAVIANGGKLVYPRLILQDIRRSSPPTPIGLKEETIRNIDRGLREVVEIGTAKQLDPTLHIAGKTGTAQNHEGNRVDHAWFIGYAPAEKPSIVVAVLVEHGGHGGAVSAPIAEAIIRAAISK